jgi:hypothetical protein
MMRDFSLTFWEAEKDKISFFVVVLKEIINMRTKILVTQEIS